MKSKLFILRWVFVLSVLIIAGCSGSLSGQPLEESTPAGEVGLANPASVFCEEQGYTLEMRTDSDGTYGMCIFPDGSGCEEWAYYRGDCEPAVEQGGTESELTAYLEIPERLLIGEEVQLKFTLKNTSDTPMYILKWYTPLEGMAGWIFQVTRDGQALQYQGIAASRGAPLPDEYVLLNSGESTSAVVSLETSYDFSTPGTYKIRFISPRISHIAFTEEEKATTLEELGPVDMPSTPVTLIIDDK